MPSSLPQHQATSPSVTRHIMVILAIALFMTVMAIVILQNVFNGPGGVGRSSSYTRGYEDGFREARDIASQSTLLSGESQPTATAHRTLSGTVLTVAGDGFTLRVKGLILDEDVDGIGMERAVTMSAETNVVVYRYVPNGEFTAAQRTFTLTGRNPLDGQESDVPPSPLRAFEGSLTDIEEADDVTVEGTANQDLTFLQTIAAGTVTVIKRPTAE